MSDKVRKQLRTFFSGYPSSYGQHDNGKNRTKKGVDAKEVDIAWKNHFDGKIGIGQIPLKKDDRNKWGAIDIDFYTTDREKRGATKSEIKKILSSIESLPLHMFLSKSRSVHLFIFYKNYQNAEHIRNTLAGYAKEIGYPTAEIFPKQNKIGDDGTGSWINIPYFGLKERTQVILSGGKLLELSPEECIEHIVPITKEPVKELPPCLEYLLSREVPQGSRNNFILNIGVLYKKQEKENWQEELRKFNYNFFTTPLKEGQLKDTIRSLENKDYSYLCEQLPISEHCDKDLCTKRKWGIGGLKYDEVEYSNLRKVMTEPPRYYLNINGSDIEFTIKELLTYKIVKIKIIESLNILPENKKSSAWESIFQNLLGEITEEEAPKDASKSGAVMNLFQEFLELRHQSKTREDLLRNLPWTHEDGELVYFQSKDAISHIRSQGMPNIIQSDLYRYLRTYGMSSSTASVNGKSINVWKFPLSHINEQTQEFEDAEITPNEY